MTVFKPGDRVQHLSSLQKGTVVGDRTTWENIAVLFDGDTHPAMTHTSNLEPAGEPMTTTFKSTNVADAPIHHLTVDDIDGEVLVQVHYGSHLKGVCVAKREAPALALAILEAVASTGAPVAPEVARAMEALEEYKQRIQAEAEEAADREALEAEALELLNAWRDENEQKHVSSFDEAGGNFKKGWVAVARAARAARTLHGVTK